MTTPTPSINYNLISVMSVVRDWLREKRKDTGANIGHMLRKEIPGFAPQALGFNSLSRLLLDAADEIVVVAQKGDDLVWALGETVADRDLEQALGADGDSDIEVPLDTRAPVSSVEFINFRSCRRVTLTLASSGLTVLVGPNSSGKSTLLYGASYASQVTRGRLRALFSGTRDVRRLRSSDATGPMELAITAGNNVELRIKAEPAGDDTKFTVDLKSPNKKATEWRLPGPPPSPPLRDRAESGLFWPSVLLRFQADALAAPSEIEEGEPRLSFDGGGLPTFLAYLANTNRERLESLVESVRKVVPAVEETRQTMRRWISYHPDDRDLPPTFRWHLEVKMNGADWVPADLLSEGTLFAFGIHAVLHQRQPPRILLMDDIDRGLHPKAQRALILQLKDVAEQGGPQIIISTHSPYILDELPAESVRVVRAGTNGTCVRALIEHPEWQNWKSSMTSGEFWTYVGDDWLEQVE